MAATFSFENEKNERLHINAIRRVSEDTNLPITEVERVYLMVLRRFIRKARIRNFLPLLVGRRVKHLLNVRMKKKDRSIMTTTH